MAKRRIEPTPEFKGMPEPDEVAIKAKIYLHALDDQDEAKEKTQTAANELVALMREKKRLTILVEGVRINLKHIEAADTISVKRPKER